MFYCENCKYLNKTSICGCCGRNGLRSPVAEDFCYLTEMDVSLGKMLKEIFDAENILCAVIPSGDGFRSSLALPLENYKLFVPYRDYAKANEIIKEIFENNCSALKKELLENLGKLNFSGKTEKKCRKKLKLSKETNFLEFIKEKVASAEKVFDAGASSYSSFGRYINVSVGSWTILIITGTWEIVSVNKTE